MSLTQPDASSAQMSSHGLVVHAIGTAELRQGLPRYVALHQLVDLGRLQLAVRLADGLTDVGFFPRFDTCLLDGSRTN